MSPKDNTGESIYEMEKSRFALEQQVEQMKQKMDPEASQLTELDEEGM